MMQHLPLNLANLARGQVMHIPYTHRGLTVATKYFIDKIHRWGKAVHVWTVNGEVTMRQLIERGVDGIVTDAPSLLVSVAPNPKKN
jgi:glycerophosphoryl diester phosphodiesterase